MDASFGGFDELWCVAMAWIEAGIGVDDADYGSGESFFTVAKSFDEDFSEEEGEVSIAV